MNEKGGYVYILANKHITTLYIGSTVDIKARIYEHKFEKGSVFTEKYNCHYLVYFKFYNSIEEARKKEFQMKSWNRNWKTELIEIDNPNFTDLSEDWYSEQIEYEN